MMNDIKVTIITVAYNCANTITDAIESVLNQSYRYIEYLVIDGASKDNTLDIARRYIPKFHAKGMEMRVISEQRILERVGRITDEYSLSEIRAKLNGGNF